ncbi:pyrimidine reductase family protein [Corynebacterium diphtheriae]
MQRDSASSSTVTTDQIVYGALPLTTINEPECRAIAITSINGSATLSGVSGPMGDQTDADLLIQLRGWADAIVVGAETARKENYGPVVLPHGIKNQRQKLGRCGLPKLTLLSKSLYFDFSSELFSPDLPLELSPLVITQQPANTSEQWDQRLQKLIDVGVEVIVAPTSTNPLKIAFDALHARRLKKISIEGGPSVYRQALSLGIVDRLHLTIAPNIICPVESPLFGKISDDSFTTRLVLEMLSSSPNGLIFLRYKVIRDTLGNPTQ